MVSGIILCNKDRIEEGVEALEATEALFEGELNPDHHNQLEILRAELDLARSRRARLAGDLKSAAAHQLRVGERIAPLMRRGPPTPARPEGLPSPAERSLSVRIGLAHLHELTRASGEAEGPPGMEIGPDTRWFRIPGGEKVDISRRRVLRRMLSALVDKRFAEPGEPMSQQDMLAAGWPGERIRPDSGANRVYVGVATLRKLGLGDLLVTTDEGYLLDGDIPAVRIEA